MTIRINSFSHALLKNYSNGIFPMGTDRIGLNLDWIQPKVRGIIPIGKMLVSRTTKKLIKSKFYSITFDEEFEKVVSYCAERTNTWINEKIKKEYSLLHKSGYAHSVEIWYNGVLIGGLYGVSIGSAFFAESMFSKKSNASKLAMLAIMARLKSNGYTLFDTQFPSAHLSTLGGLAVTQEAFICKLRLALKVYANFNNTDQCNDWNKILTLATGIVV